MMIFSSVIQYTMQYKFNIRNVAWQFAIQWYQQNVTLLNVSYKHCWNGHKNAFQRLYICAYLFHYLHFVLYIYLFRKIYDNIEVPICFWWRVMNRYKKLNRDVRCKNLCSRPENVNAGKLHSLGNRTPWVWPGRSCVPFQVKQQVMPQFDLNISAGFTDVYVVQVFHMSLN